MESAGRVEVCIHGVWGRVCVANRFDFYGNYSRVVCRQLGYNVDAGKSELNHALGKRIGDGVTCYLYGSRLLCRAWLLFENGDFSIMTSV